LVPEKTLFSDVNKQKIIGKLKGQNKNINQSFFFLKGKSELDMLELFLRNEK
jgi:hypothetical protein